jgi:serine/threonine-protein phosphatase 6 catalytic subunit
MVTAATEYMSFVDSINSHQQHYSRLTTSASKQQSFNVDECIETLRQGEIISEYSMKILCKAVSELCCEEGNVQPVSSPVTIVGDLHGQHFDLLHMLSSNSTEEYMPPNTSYIFLGDFVDRGHNSVETLSLLLCLKLKYPAHVTLLRGNHESRQITQVYGFYDECVRKYGNAAVWRHAVATFDTMGLAAMVDGRVLTVHGGLSPDVRTLDQIRAIDRYQEIPRDGAFCDLVWSDPEESMPHHTAWQISPRGAGYLFGSRVTQEFCQVNALQLIARAHQLVMEGRKYHFNQQLVTVWSAPNYCYRCGNLAAVLELGEQRYGGSSTENMAESMQLTYGPYEGLPGHIAQRFRFFRETEESMHGPKGEERARLVPYFL